MLSKRVFTAINKEKYESNIFYQFFIYCILSEIKDMLEISMREWLKEDLRNFCTIS